MPGYEIAVLSGLDDLGYNVGTGILDVLTGGSYSAANYVGKKIGGKTGSLVGQLLTGLPVKEIGNFVDDPGWKKGTQIIYGFIGGLPNSIVPDKYKKYCAGIAIGIVYTYYTGDAGGGLVLAKESSTGFGKMEKGDGKGVAKTFVNVGKHFGQSKGAAAFSKTKWGGKSKEYFDQLSSDKKAIIKGAGALAVGAALKGAGLMNTPTGLQVIEELKQKSASLPPDTISVPDPQSDTETQTQGMSGPAKAAIVLAGGGLVVGGSYWLYSKYLARRA